MSLRTSALLALTLFLGTAPLADAQNVVASPPAGPLDGSGTFGDTVKSDGDLLVVVDSFEKTVSVLDQVSLAFESDDLMALSTVTPTTIWDVAVDGADERVFVLCQDASSAYVMSFERFEVLGTPIWTQGDVAPTTPLGSGRLAFGAANTAEPDGVLFAAWTNETDDAARIFSYDPPTLLNSGAFPLFTVGRVLSMDVATFADGYHVAFGLRDPQTFVGSVGLVGYNMFGFAPGPAQIISPYGISSAFGESVALSDGHLFIGSPGEDGASGRVDHWIHPIVPVIPNLPIYEFVGSFGNPAPEPQDEFGRALALSPDGDVLAIAERQNDFVPGSPFDFSGMVRLMRRDGSGAWSFSGEVFQDLVDPSVFLVNFGRSLDLNVTSTGALALNVGAPGIETLEVFPVPAESWVAEDLSPGLAGFGGAAPDLELTAGLYAFPDLVPGPLRIAVRGARPGAFASLVIGLGVANAPLKQGILYPLPSLVIPVITDAAGDFVLDTSWSEDSVSIGTFDLPMQVWVQDPDGPQNFASTPGAELRQP